MIPNELGITLDLAVEKTRIEAGDRDRTGDETGF